MLELRPVCENCGKDLPNKSDSQSNLSAARLHIVSMRSNVALPS